MGQQRQNHPPRFQLLMKPILLTRKAGAPTRLSQQWYVSFVILKFVCSLYAITSLRHYVLTPLRPYRITTNLLVMFHE